MKTTMLLTLLIAPVLLTLTGCQVGYLIKNSWHQQKILRSRVPIKEVLQTDSTDEETRRKLNLVKEVKAFAEKELGLVKSDNYESYVDLGRPYVTWIVRAAPLYELKAYQWWFPIIGSVPYKGYFNKKGATDEANGLKEKGLDTYVRGVTAYSTLGWFDDPVLSSMLRYEDHDLVNVIIHETVHATVFIENHVDFNERLATFVGNIGAEIFYRNRPGGQKVLEAIAKENSDQKLFSEFISEELRNLKASYKANRGKLDQQKKQSRIDKIKQRFLSNLKPNLKTTALAWFEKAELNNASLLSLETYQSDLSDFEKLYKKLGNDFKALINFCKSLEDRDDPEKALKLEVADVKL